MTIDDTTLVTDSLSAGARTRRAAAQKLSAELAALKAGGADIRPGALRVVDLLAEADRLEILAERFPESTSLGERPDSPVGGSSLVAAPPTETPDGVEHVFDDGDSDGILVVDESGELHDHA